VSHCHCVRLDGDETLLRSKSFSTRQAQEKKGQPICLSRERQGRRHIFHAKPQKRRKPGRSALAFLIDRSIRERFNIRALWYSACVVWSRKSIAYDQPICLSARPAKELRLNSKRQAQAVSSFKSAMLAWLMNYGKNECMVLLRTR
jgi:hypothetical protein